MVLSEVKPDRPVDLRSDGLVMRLAETPVEIAASQSLRFRMFRQELNAKPGQEMAPAQREFDSFDAYGDHLLAFGRNEGTGAEAVEGSYRLLRRETARHQGID